MTTGWGWASSIGLFREWGLQRCHPQWKMFGTGLSTGLQSACSLIQKRPLEYHRKVDAATRCLGACSHTQYDSDSPIPLWLFWLIIHTAPDAEQILCKISAQTHLGLVIIMADRQHVHIEDITLWQWNWIVYLFSVECHGEQTTVHTLYNKSIVHVIAYMCITCVVSFVPLC